MPGLIRKIAIIAAVDGLILQPHGSWIAQNDNKVQSAIHIEYKNCKIAPWRSLPLKTYPKGTVLEAYGVIGLLSIASSSYLVSINRREQVAHIFGKPIYVITDVSFLPLLSKGDAEREIASINANNRQLDGYGSYSDTDTSGDESTFEVRDRASTSEDDVSTPLEQDRQMGIYASLKRLDKVDKAENVNTSSRQYDRFAASWLSKRGWNLPLSTDIQDGGSQNTNSSITSSPPNESATSSLAEGNPSLNSMPHNNGRVVLRPKLLKTAKMLLSSRNFFYSYDYNITRRFGHPDQEYLKDPSGEALESTFFWNKHLAKPFLANDSVSYVVPVMQGFVGQRTFSAKLSSSASEQTTAVESLERLLVKDRNKVSDNSSREQSFLLTIISRRSVDRAGLRYTRRGVDDYGNVANFCETEQILSSPFWDTSINPRAFLQLRGSIPLYFSQSPYSFKPLPVIHHSQGMNENAMGQHFRTLAERYGKIQVACLVDKQGSEARIGNEFQSYSERLRDSSEFFRNRLEFDWFDFHGECRGMKFENVSQLVEKMAPKLSAFGENVISSSETNKFKTIANQGGSFRVNCMDCLDRTNVVQSAFGQYMLENALRSEGFETNFQLDSHTQWFNSLWADNGDALSRQYASTAALKGDFVRTRKRDYRGMMNDFALTLSRYYSNTVNDYFSQTVIDFVLGNATEVALDEFETNMMNADPGISIDVIRQNAIQTCEKLAVQDADEELKNGWIMLSPSQPNTLRALPMEEIVVLLTGAALYSCRFDWNTEKLASFERIELQSINKIVYGTYITSTLTEPQRDEERNIGLVVSYRPGKETITRVNTRSLQNEVENLRGENEMPSPVSKGLSSFSWLTHRYSSTSTQMLALKASPVGSAQGSSGSSKVALYAQGICEEIQKAKIGDSSRASDCEDAFVEQAHILSLSEAEKRTGYLEQLGHQIKRFVWA